MSENWDELLAGLRDVGLSRYEAAVYLGLVTDQTARVAEISRRTGVPQPKVYQALDSLVDKGFVSLGSDQVNRYQPVPPRLAFANHLASLQKQQDEAQSLGEDLQTLLMRSRGKDLWAPPIEIVKGVRQIGAILVDHVERAQERVLYFGKNPVVKLPAIPQALLRASQRGVKLRMVYEEGYLDAAGELGEREAFLGIDSQARVAESLPTKMIVVDGRIAMLSVTRQEKAEDYLVLALRHSGLLAHILASFEYHWAQARSLERL